MQLSETSSVSLGCWHQLRGVARPVLAGSVGDSNNTIGNVYPILSLGIFGPRWQN